MAACCVLFTAATTTAPIAPGELSAQEVEVIAEPGALLRIGDDLFKGPLRISARDGELSVVESLGPEEYLLGIREVPFGWPEEALKAQAVAARTYLAFTLAAGRGASAARHGYDICATTACQVYSGRAGLATNDGQHWQQAVDATAGEILVYEGRPAQALYSSTAGTRTRESEDIFPGLDVPYLAAVDSPGEASPFVAWSFLMTEREMTSLLDHSGLITGPLTSVEVETTPDGDGPWQVRVGSARGMESVATYRFRSLFNRAAADLLPQRFPVTRPSGRRYPQTILSGTFTISTIPVTVQRPGYKVLTRMFQIAGEGWGHQVGMSQYGALALAEVGASYSEILAHYYGGLRPEGGSAWLPEVIRVGLVIGEAQVAVLAEGGATVRVDGEPVAPAGIGVWRFQPVGDSVVSHIPVGVGTAPRVRGVGLHYEEDIYTLRFRVTAPGFVEISTTARGVEGGRLDLGLVEAGEFNIPLYEVTGREVDVHELIRVVVTASSPIGNDSVVLVRILRIPISRVR
ncbi:MAG: SpoIID/LytB domain-containing protein [Actinomycetota bacterium]